MIRLTAAAFLIGFGFSALVLGTLIGRKGDWQSAAAMSGVASIFWFTAGAAAAQRRAS